VSLRDRRRLPLEQLAPYLLELPEQLAPLDWGTAFGNDRPVEIEVGPGKGLFLVTEAQGRPGVNFLGVEVQRKYQLYAATRAARRSLANVKVACADARLFLRDAVAAESVQAVHVYFPDPWWKKRHHRRRVFTPEFAAQCQRVLRPGGRLYVATDVEDYFGLMTQAVRENTQLEPLPPPEPGEPAHDMDYLTNYERKARTQGKTVYRAVYARPVGPVTPPPHTTGP
jgi:tRNA (guanine-N7-)-methyltransferase